MTNRWMRFLRMGWFLVAATTLTASPFAAAEAQVAEDELEAWTRQLDSDDDAVGMQAATRLRSAGAEGLAVLVDRVSRQRRVQMSRIGRAIGLSDEHGALLLTATSPPVKQLGAMVRSASPMKRRRLASDLLGLCGSQAAGEIRALLRSPRLETRELGARALLAAAGTRHFFVPLPLRSAAHQREDRERQWEDPTKFRRRVERPDREWEQAFLAEWLAARRTNARLLVIHVLPALLEAMHLSHDQRTETFERTLGLLGDFRESVKTRFLRLAEDQGGKTSVDQRVAAIQALAAFNVPDATALPLLRRLAGSSEQNDVRRVAKEALARRLPKKSSGAEDF